MTVREVVEHTIEDVPRQQKLQGPMEVTQTSSPDTEARGWARADQKPIS
jgi:hypothetical protein